MVNTTKEPACTTLFVKVERLRRLQRATEYTYTVRRGDDGSFGLGLSEDNEIVHFYHEENTSVLRLGDQIRAVGDQPLVRERLASLLQRCFPDEETVSLHISRTIGEKQQKQSGEEAFAALQLRNAYGDELDEWLSELWELRTDAVWGTFWTLPILSGATTAWFGLHLSKLFSEPLIGSVEIPLASLTTDKVDTRWYSLRDEDDSEASRNEIDGEILLTTRKFVSSASISPGGLDDDFESDEEPDGPIDHATEPLRPIADAPIPVRSSGLL